MTSDRRAQPLAAQGDPPWWGRDCQGPPTHLAPFSCQVHDYLRSKLCSLYENDCIFDKFECAWNGSDR